MLAAGLDGYPRGWVAVLLREGEFARGSDVFHLPEEPRQFDAGRPILIWARRR